MKKLIQTMNNHSFNKGLIEQLTSSSYSDQLFEPYLLQLKLLISFIDYNHKNNGKAVNISKITKQLLREENFMYKLYDMCQVLYIHYDKLNNINLNKDPTLATSSNNAASSSAAASSSSSSSDKQKQTSGKNNLLKPFIL